MLLEDLPTETVVDIFFHISTVQSVLALSTTCRRFRIIFKSSSRLAILGQAAEQQYGPTHDIIQLMTYNTSQPAHHTRSAALSDALLVSIVKIGRVAARWEDIYPLKKWKGPQASDRRLLNGAERHALRRAVYRLWLFTAAFHTPAPAGANGRLQRCTPQAVARRDLLLHNYSTAELAEMLDVHNVFRDVVANNICPSNGAVRRKFDKRFPGSTHQLLFNIHLNYPPPSGPAMGNAHYSSDTYSNHFFHHHPQAQEQRDAWARKPGWQQQRQQNNRFIPTRTHEPGAEGWGDDVLHYYVVEDMLKLDPERILFLRDAMPLKRDVEAYVRGVFDGTGGSGVGTDAGHNSSGQYYGESNWFDNNGETFCQSMDHVITSQRSGDYQACRLAVDEGELGIAVDRDLF